MWGVYNEQPFHSKASEKCEDKLFNDNFNLAEEAGMASGLCVEFTVEDYCDSGVYQMFVEQNVENTAASEVKNTLHIGNIL